MRFTATIYILFAGVIGGMGAPNPKQEGERLFSLKVEQIFSSKCFACHGEEPRRSRASLI